MKNIYFLWATVRPEMMLDTYKQWKNNSVTDTNIILKIAVLYEEQKNKIDSYGIQNCEVVIVNDKSGYNYAITNITKKLEANDDDILILLSDDFGCVKGWDEFILGKFENYDGAVFLNDGYQNPKAKKGGLCITLACLTFNTLKKLNKIVFHPDYRHYFSDNEAFVNFKELGVLKDDRDTDKFIFNHNHYIRGGRVQDEHDVLNYSFWKQDQILFQKRMKMPLKERLE